jgi:putative FmdB family regulatory protein
MPLYEYQCAKCEHTFEKLVLNSEPDECPECHSPKLERLLSLPAKPGTATSLPTACQSSGPPCGPRCSRF